MRCTLKLLGPFGLFSPDGVRFPINSRKTMALLALLALAPDGERTRTWVRTMLWGSRQEEQAQGSLRRELSTLRALLATHGTATILHADAQRVRLDLSQLDVDALSYGTGLASAADTRPGDFLEGIDLRDCNEFEEWLREHREYFAKLQRFQATAVVLPDVRPEELLGSPLPHVRALVDGSVPQIPGKPSIAVLPYIDASNPSQPSLLGSGLAEEIGHSLSLCSQLVVIATGACDALVAEGLSPIAIGKRLGVRFLVNGRIERRGPTIRVLTRLLDAGTAAQLWSHSCEGDVDNLFALQDRVAEAIAPQIWSTIDYRERSNSINGTAMTRSMDSYTLYWRANSVFREWTGEAVNEAIALCDQLLALEPNNPFGASLAAFCHAMAFRMNMVPDPQAALRNALRMHQIAMVHGSDNIHVLGYLVGAQVMIGGQMEMANRLVARALTINPASQPTLFWAGWVDIVCGNAERAREQFELSLRINPVSGVRAYALTGIGIAMLMQGAFEDAYAILSDAILFIAHYPMTLAAYCVAAALVGEKEAARAAALTLRETGLEQTVIDALQNPVHQAMLRMGLRMAAGDEPPHAPPLPG